MTSAEVLEAAKAVERVYWQEQAEGAVDEIVASLLKIESDCAGFTPPGGWTPACFRCGYNMPPETAVCNRRDCPFKPLASSARAA